MGESFLKFKKRRNVIRVCRALMVGFAAGFVASGAWLILYKLAVIEFHPVTSLLVGLAALLLAGGITFLLTGKRDDAFAKELDHTFLLKARVQTMVAYAEETGEMLDIQRADAEDALSKIPLKSYKFKKLWIFVLVLVLSVVPLVSGLVIKDVREIPHEEEVTPFELSALQENGLIELIRHVENSGVEEEFKTPMVEELQTLLDTLRVTKTQDAMLEAVQACMTELCAITYESSTETEILNALWKSDDIYFKHLAVTLSTHEWNTPDWGDFAEKIIQYESVLMGDGKNDGNVSGGLTAGKNTLKFALDTMSRSLDLVLSEAAVPEDDEIVLAINDLFKRNPGGFAPLLASLDYINEDAAREQLKLCFELNSESLYNAISLNKINASEGEHAMLRLSALFIVPLPEFERPDFVKNGETVGGDSTNDDKENNNQNHGGGLGTGATYGSNDIVLDPLTGEPTEYGKLLAEYYGKMYGKLEGDSYTEEQKEAIRKYFSLLYSSTQKQEGN